MSNTRIDVVKDRLDEESFVFFEMGQFDKPHLLMRRYDLEYQLEKLGFRLVKIKKAKK